MIIEFLEKFLPFRLFFQVPFLGFIISTFFIVIIFNEWREFNKRINTFVVNSFKDKVVNFFYTIITFIYLLLFGSLLILDITFLIRDVIWAWNT